MRSSLSTTLDLGWSRWAALVATLALEVADVLREWRPSVAADECLGLCEQGGAYGVVAWTLDGCTCYWPDPVDTGGTP